MGLRTSKRVPGAELFPEMPAYDPVTQALLTSQIGTSEESERLHLSDYRVNQACGLIPGAPLLGRNRSSALQSPSPASFSQGSTRCNAIYIRSVNKLC